MIRLYDIFMTDMTKGEEIFIRSEEHTSELQSH